MSEETTAPANPAPLPPPRRWRWLATLGCVLALCGGVVWLLASEGGLRVVCRVVERLAGEQLRIEAPAGALKGSFSLQAVHWRSATLDLQLQEVQLIWRPVDLLRGRLAISRVSVERLRISHVANSEPLQLPDNLQLAFAVDIEQLVVARIELGEYALPDGKAAAIAESVEGQLASNGALHRLSGLRARVAGLSVVGEASLEASRPFALTAKAGVEGEAAGRALVFDAVAEGRLEEFMVIGSARPRQPGAAEAFAGQLRARMTPFSSQPVGEALVTLSAIDPAVWIEGAPQAVLDVQVELQPRDGSPTGLGGRLTMLNRRPGSLDRHGLPFESLRAGLSLGNDELRLADLDVRLLGGGRLQGSGTVRDAELALRLAVRSLDASALHGGLRRTRLAGPLRATIGLNRQVLETELSDPQFTIQGRLAIDPATVLVEKLRLVAGDAQLVASGQVAQAGSGKFALRGALQNFDPSRFAKLPPARLNADFDAQGSSRPQLALGLRFGLRNSHLGTEALSGSGEIDLAGQRLRKADVELIAGNNRLTAKGAFGAVGDRLTLSITAPKLDPLGIAGDINGQLVLGGSASAPELSADLKSTRLAFAGVGQIRGLNLVAQLGDGNQGVVSGKLHLAGVDLASGSTVLRELALEADGVRSRHRLRGQLGLSGKRELQLLLEGGLAAAAAGLNWSGTLREFTLSSGIDRSQPFLRLAAAAPLQVGTAALNAGPADFLGAGWSLHLERVRYQQQRWQSVGSLHALPVVDTLREFPEWFESFSGAVKGNGDSLRVNGEWDIGSAPAIATWPQRRRPTGRLRLWRASGDLSIGALPLGLEEGTFNLLAADGRLAGQFKLRGKRLGELAGELDAASSAAAVLDRVAPWHGQLRVSAPDLAWAGPLLGEGWQLGGRLAGAMRIEGTPAQPRLSGEWRGDDLALRVLDQAMRLEKGKLLVELSGEADGDVRLVLKQLSFDSLLQPLPRALLLDPGIDAGTLTGKPGRVEATGELRAGHAEGVLTLRAERLGVMQRPDQWVLVSGDAQFRLGERVLDVLGRFRLDAGYWELARSGTPQLSEDVLIKRQSTAPAKVPAPVRLLSLDLDAELGRHFHFRGAGVESRLVGAVNLRSAGSGLPRATGTIRTHEGRFDAYGQKLEIERGILNFQGLIDNPGLNIRAVRGNLPVEAGVEVTGTARRPVVRLVSDPEVPDAEKLSWLVLGHAPDQQRGQDSAMLLAAAQTILGGQDGGPLKAVQRGLGIDEFGISSGRLDGSGQRQTSRIASTTGFGPSDTTTGQIVSVGKRLSSNMLISYDQSLTTAGSIVKLTVNLSRNLSLVGRAGSDTGLDLLWNYRFGR
ncbi:translocation/assembly module TamB domain-containing protein [Accumulibacter sp.]|uniref:translocation/assembly module TamB domain-containing protein n=1 Tax=Accumulibacter sp. TaxID=2053492 RepID=UPI002BCFF54E|nr:translocation/assembly module TamB domain-containing protein [Accumulibacter sp.]HPU80229.1 translocation/assembly module TamB domain-containing protein [Accumulibacter sp.]